MARPEPSIPVLDLGRAIKRVQNAHHRALDLALSEAGLSLTQFDALRAIDRHPGATSRRLATVVFMTDQSFGALANRLIAKGLVYRQAERGRALSHGLTSAGHEAVMAGAAIAARVLEGSFVDLDEDERGLLLGLLLRLLPENAR